MILGITVFLVKKVLLVPQEFSATLGKQGRQDLEAYQVEMDLVAYLGFKAYLEEKVD